MAASFLNMISHNSKPKSLHSLMAALSIGHPFNTTKIPTKNQINKKKTIPRTLLVIVSCQTRDSRGPEMKMEDNKEKKEVILKVFVEIGKMGKGLKDSLSPKQKGDWKDLVLMSLSFAVYVYISQKIVCSYCAWVSMVKQHW